MVFMIVYAKSAFIMKASHLALLVMYATIVERYFYQGSSKKTKVSISIKEGTYTIDGPLYHAVATI